MDKKFLYPIIIIFSLFFLVAVWVLYNQAKQSALKKTSLSGTIEFEKISQDELVYYLDNDDVGLKTYNFQTNQKKDLYKKPLGHVLTLEWSHDIKKTLTKVEVSPIGKYRGILHTPSIDTDQPIFWLIDVVSNIATPLDKNIISADWLSEDKIIYIYNNSGKYSLNQADPDGANWQKLVDLDKEFTGLKVSPDGKKVALFPQLSIYDVATKKISAAQISTVSDVQWSPDSQQIAVFTSDKTQIYNIAKNQAAALKEKIDSNKFIWLSNEEAIIAKSGKYGDEIYKLNINTQKTKSLFKSTKKQPIEVENFLLSPDTKKLYLVNKKDYYLYEITLEK